jgi:hypothetical protein
VVNVNVVEPFERALMMYQKSTDKLYFLIIYAQAQMALFAVNKPADFIIATGFKTQIKDRTGEAHTALIMTPLEAENAGQIPAFFNFASSLLFLRITTPVGAV